MSDSRQPMSPLQFRQVEIAKREWEMAMDSVSEIVVLLDASGRIRRCNRPLTLLAARGYRELLGMEWQVLLAAVGLQEIGQEQDGVEFFHPPSGRGFRAVTYPFAPDSEGPGGAVLTLRDITQGKELTRKLEEKNREIERQRAALLRALDELSFMIRRIAEEGELGGQLELPQGLPPCWQVMRCEQSDCPCYGREAVRCWQWAGTRCRGEVQGGFVQKFNACEQCRFYQDIVSDPVCRIGEEFNHMVFILAEKKRELAQAYDELKGSQAKLLQQEKMASIGQLAAGVAHEINNPMGFVTSNLGSLGKYLARLEEFLARQSEVVARCAASAESGELAELRKALKVDFILHDASSLIRESLDGAARVRTIVQNLKSFSRVDQAQECSADINRCLEDTINIVWNELKYKCEVKKEYGDLPPTYCFPQQLNQVFMNLLVNAAQAIAERGTITIRTWQEGDEIRVAVGDSGCGIPPENLNRLFEPFFTTKEVGKGTGLGLSITYDIVKKHGGRIEVASEPGKGATFTVCLPIRGEAHGE
ncbi:MAG: ATP-binding protein [Thermodesulfobacteriota bacterium]